MFAMVTPDGDIYFPLFFAYVFSKFCTNDFCNNKPQNIFQVSLHTKSDLSTAPMKLGEMTCQNYWHLLLTYPLPTH